MKKYIIILIISISFFGHSCKKDFLEVIDKTKLLKQGYVVDIETTAHYMNGIYVLLAYSTGYADGYVLSYPELIADNIKLRPNRTISTYTWTQRADELGNYNGPGQWLSYYKIIRACNFVIEKAEEYKNEDMIRAANIKGQALAIRAWIHFLLVNIFAQSYNYTSDASHLGIPYVLSSDIEEAVSRQPVAMVYQNIITDLNNALQLLPVSEISKRHIFNYGATKALLARVYLFKEDFANAKNLSLEVLKDVPLMTSGYPTNLYTVHETEALFQAFPAKAETDSYNPAFIGYLTSAKTVFYFRATRNITQLYRQHLTDKRNAWVRDSITPSNTFYGTLITKFPKAVAGLSSIPETDYYQTLFRSSEMVLTAAESYAKLNREDSARYFINLIRNRAGIPVVTLPVTGTALMDSIRTERQKEMAFDGIRMYDLLRWKLGVHRLDPSSSTVQTLSYPSNKAIAPIPLVDVQLLGLQQNPGY